jgi:hypothetical protein
MNGVERAGAGLPDADWLETLRLMWTERDPMPDDLADRVSVALAVADLDAELLELVEGALTGAGARGEDRTRTVTFSNETVSVMVTIDHGAGGARLDGWVTEGGGLRVELRTGPTSRDTVADEDGRFAFDGVPAGLVRLVLHPTDGAALRLGRPVTTPGVEI